MLKSARLWLMLLAIIGGLTIAVACGGDDDDGDGDGPTATASVDGNATPSEGDGDGDGASGSLDDLGDLEISEMKASYEMTSSAGTSTMTVYWKDGTHWRLDLESDGSVTIFLQNDDGAFFCDPGSETCISSPGGLSTIPIPFFAAFTQPDGLANFVTGSFGGADVDTSSETIAGRDADCYRVSGSVEGESGYAEVCTADGIVLRWAGGSNGETVKIEATSVEDTVADADLEAPYPVEDIPGLD